MKQFVMAITGPAGAGKSTIAKRVANKLERCVNIEADDIKRMIVSGFHKDSNDSDGWVFDQWELVGDSIGLLAANFKSNGYSVIINGYIDELGWLQIQNHVAINHKLLLLPEVNTAISRFVGRHDDKGLGEASVVRHHKTFSAENFYQSFKKIDTTNHSVEETVESIFNIAS